MATPDKPNMALVPHLHSSTRFDAARQEAAERATIDLASTMVDQVAKRLARAQALLTTASGSNPGPRTAAMEQAKASLEEAFAELGEVVREIRG